MNRMENEKRIPRVEEERVEGGMIKTKLIIPHGDGYVTFYNSHMYRTYQSAGKRIINAGLRVPTGEEVASLIYAAYCVPEIENDWEFEKARAIMGHGIWNFNRNLWTPEGVYVVQDPEALGGSQPFNINQLEKSLKRGKERNGIRFSEDGTVRFAPEGSYKSGEHTSESLAKDGYIIASYGIEGAEKLGEVFYKFKYIPARGLDIFIIRGGSELNDDLDSLGVYGVVLGGDVLCGGFGVLKDAN